MPSTALGGGLAEGHVLEVEGGPVRNGCGRVRRPRHLDVPGMNTRLLVISNMNAALLAAKVGGETLLRMTIKGLWSIQSWKGWPSRRKPKCLIPKTEASRSLSKVE